MTTPEAAAPDSPLPLRLHHHAYVTADQERTRHFYEDVLGLPLTQFWIEEGEFDGRHMTFSHAFYGNADGSALAFFNFDDEAYQTSVTARRSSIFEHVSLATTRANQDAIEHRLKAVGIDVFAVDHGYTRSIYVHDPDGLLVEFSVDPDNIEQIAAHQARTCHAALKDWMSGSRTVNNDLRALGISWSE